MATTNNIAQLLSATSKIITENGPQNEMLNLVSKSLSEIMEKLYFEHNFQPTPDQIQLAIDYWKFKFFCD